MIPMEMETQFRLKVESLLMTASWVDRLRHELGLLGASQVWGDRPAWYVWLAGSPGAFHLEMLESSVKSDDQEDLARAVFSIRFYPSPQSDIFGLFSPQERALMQNGCFDHTGTPYFEKLNAIPPRLFTVGALELLCDPRRDWMVFSLAALDLCREIRVTHPGPAKDALSEVVVRSVPGWDISHALFSNLLSLWAFQSKQTPARLQMTTENGLEALDGIPEAPPIRDAPDISLQNMWVLFCPDAARPPEAALGLMNAELNEPGREELCRLDCSCRHLHRDALPLKPSGLISERWWELAHAEYKSERCTSCGCDHH